jgi:hypothetical protein
MMKNKKQKKSFNPIAVAHSLRGGSGAGPHRNRVLTTKKGSSRKIKHRDKKDD